MESTIIDVHDEVGTQHTVERRTFLKVLGLGAAGMMPVLSMLGCSPKKASEIQAAAASPTNVAAVSEAIDVSRSDELFAKVLEESPVNGDLTMPDGTVIPAVYLRMRNRINRIGRGIGSIPKDSHSWDMIRYLWSEEDAENYLAMPMHTYFTAGDYSKLTGKTEEESLSILEDQADRCLIWRVRRGGLPVFALIPYINGFWEFNELLAHYSGKEGAVAEFDTQGITGVDPGGESGFDTTFPLFRSYPIGPEVVDTGVLDPYQDWRAIIKRNNTITVSPCQCRTMWEALGVDFPSDHPRRTCLSLGEMAEYFIENGIGEKITQDEAIAIVEDVIDHGMVVESICARNPDIICSCHSKSCGNLMAWRGVNGEGVAARYFSAYMLQYDKESCIRCGKCIDICPMQSISWGDDGFCQMDAACVRCGQCVKVCPNHARVLHATEGYPELPSDYVDTNVYFAKDRMQRGQIVDITESSTLA